MTVLSRTANTFAPPVMAARRWLEGVTFPPDRPLINVSQAAPADPPPEALRKVIAEAALETPEAHLYGPVLGLPELRAEIAAQWQSGYGGKITADQVAITSGCNQAFCATMASLCTEKDEVILPTPWYFNHKMWLDMSGVTSVPLATGDDLLPDPERAESLITDRTRAIVLVSPNNPGGLEYPEDLVMAFYRLAQSRGVKLIIDETYRDFDARNGAPHALFQDPDWPKTLIHLYSFSKAFRLTGHRVGAIIADQAMLMEVEKFLDTVAICPNQLGQIAALWGLQNMAQWCAGERAEILDRRAAIEDYWPAMDAQGWALQGLGAFFAYVRHPFEMSSADLAPALVREAGVLLLPGTMFYPEGDVRAPHELRIAFANIDRSGIKTLFERLSALPSPLASAPRSA
ncbi:MAG: aminotransferase [Pseudomonadota bacterium]